MTPLCLPLRSVNVGRPRLLGLHHGKTVMSGIAKAPVSGDRIRLSETNLEGDGQADLEVHGGAEKAVYAYSTVHWPDWQKDYGLRAAPGTFGENLTLDGARENEIHIGDVFAWGDGLLMVCQPRAPCFKLNLYLGRDDIAAALTKTARSGFYLKVLRGGLVPVRTASLTRLEHKAAAPTVQAMFLALHTPQVAREVLTAYAVTEGLSEAWRQALEKRIAARTGS